MLISSLNEIQQQPQSFPDSRVEDRQFICGNPIFPMLLTASILDLISHQKIPPHAEASDETAAARGHVPITSNFCCVLFA
jgi:hypothetical protein